MIPEISPGDVFVFRDTYDSAFCIGARDEIALMIYEITRSVLSEQAFIEKIVRILLDALGFRIIGYTGRIKQPNCLDGLGENASFSVEDVAIIAEKKAYYFFPEYCILDTPEGCKSCSCEVFDRFINGIPEHIKVSLNSLFKPAFSTPTQKEMLLAYITDRNNPDTILKNYEKQLEKSHVKWIEAPKNRSVSDK